MKWPISWSVIKDHIDDIEDGIDPKLLPKDGVGYVESGKGELFNDTVTCDDPADPEMFALEGFIPVDGKEYEITMNGVTVKRTAFDPGRTHPDLGMPVGMYAILGNMGALDPSFENTGDDWNITYAPDVFGVAVVNWHTGTPPESLAVRIVGETETIHPIDPKFIPALDSLTMNGADGKQYKLAVDESGALAATAIE